MKLLLRRLRWWSRGEERRGDLRLAGGRVREAGASLAPARGETVLDLEGHLALPGLVNGHDHLGLDVLPPLGDPPYTSFYDWAEEIHRPDEPPLREALALPLRDRIRWGAYRNLIFGATTVLHHDPFVRRPFRDGLPVRVERPDAWCHSPGFASGEELDRARRALERGGTFVVHAAEGTDERAAGELDELDRRGLLAPGAAIVHGLGARPDQLATLAARGAALVWCPSSNLRLYGRTLRLADLGPGARLALGTDSTISGSAGLLDELRAAAATGQASPAGLLSLVTDGGARALGLDDGRGTLGPGGPADLLLWRPGEARRTGEPEGDGAAECLLRLRPADLELVVVRGRVGLASPERAAELGLGAPNASVGGRPRWLRGPFRALRERVARAAIPGFEGSEVASLLAPAGALEGGGSAGDVP